MSLFGLLGEVAREFLAGYRISSRVAREAQERGADAQTARRMGKRAALLAGEREREARQHGR